MATVEPPTSEDTPSLENCDVMHANPERGPCDACFAQWTAGSGTISLPGVYNEPVVCGPTDVTGVLASSCSGATLVGSLGSDCRAACKYNAQVCASAFRKRCTPGEHGAQSFDCSCLSPAGRSWGAETYEEVTGFLTSNGMTFDPRCVWPACAPGRASYVLQDNAVACPSTTLKCAVGDYSITLQDVQASSVSLIEQQCGVIAGGGDAHIDKSGTISGWTQTQFLWIALSVGVCVCILIASLLAVWYSRRLRRSRYLAAPNMLFIPYASTAAARAVAPSGVAAGIAAGAAYNNGTLRR